MEASSANESGSANAAVGLQPPVGTLENRQPAAAAGTGESNLRFRSVKRHNPLYQGSVKFGMREGADVIHEEELRVLMAHMCVAPGALRKTSVDSIERGEIYPVAGGVASDDASSKLATRLDTDVKALRGVMEVLDESERLEVLHNVRLGSISVDEALAISTLRANEGRLSKTGSPTQGERDVLFKDGQVVPTPLSPTDRSMDHDTGLSALAAGVRGGQWKEMTVKLDKSVLTFETSGDNPDRMTILSAAVQVELIENVPVNNKVSIRLVIPDEGDIYLFGDSDATTVKWHGWLMASCLPATTADAKDTALERSYSEQIEEPSDSGVSGLTAASEISEDPNTSAAEMPLPEIPLPSALPATADQGDGETSPENPSDPQLMRSPSQRSFRSRKSFNRVDSVKSMSGVTPAAPGVIAADVGDDGDDGDPTCDIDTAYDEADERVGEMENNDDSNACDYLEAEISKLRATMEAGLAGGSNEGYSMAYQAMAGIGVGQPAEASQREMNKLKNRYGNIMAYDHSRVKLDVINGDPDTDYVNGNWIDGWQRDRAYIATQGPVPNSFISFWRMIWYHEVEIIVMVTHEVEKGRMKCHRYWPDPTSTPPVKQLQYGSIYVTHLITHMHKHYALRVFEVEFEGVKRVVKQYAYLSWPDHGVPLATSELLGFRNAVRKGRTNLSKPLVVHCSAGVGRTGTYIAIDRLLEQTFSQVPDLDIDMIIREMRERRNHMVQTEIQYIFIFRAVMDALTELYAEETEKAAEAEKIRESGLAVRSTTIKRAEEAARLAQEQEEIEAREIEAARAKLEEERQQQEKAKQAEEKMLSIAATEHTAQAAQAVIKTSISERISFLDKHEERWLAAYKSSLDEWNDRNQFGAENYDVSSALTPIQSRLEALKQKGMLM